MVGKIFIISAPSGAGKSTLVAATLVNLEKEWPIERVVTYTSKNPRNNEVPGQDYHFIKVDEFERRIKQGFFLEWSNAYGTYYGSPRSIVNQVANGYSYIGIIDRVGASKIKAQFPQAVLVWIEAPSLQELSRRLVSRGTETDEQIAKRLARAKIEIDLEMADPIYDHLLVNDQFVKAQKELEDLIVGYLEKIAKKSKN